MTDLSLRHEPIEGLSAWVGCDVRAGDYRVELSGASLDEIRRVVEEIRAYPLPTIVLRPEDFVERRARELDPVIPGSNIAADPGARSFDRLMP